MIDLGDIARHQFRPFSADADVPPAPHIPPGRPRTDPALDGGDGPYRPQPGPWQPTHHDREAA